LSTTEEATVKDHTRIERKLGLTTKQAEQAERAFQRDLKEALEQDLIGLITTEDGRTLIYVTNKEDLSS
jgi:hypothetical protein